MNRCVKVIASFFGPRAARYGFPWPHHNQPGMTAAEAREMVRRQAAAEYPGVDVVVVTNGVNRPNDGGSYGAYNWAFQQYRGRYDWWLFTEDDIVVGGPRYYDRLIEKFEHTPYCGFVGVIGVEPGFTIHAHGGIGLTSGAVLEKVADYCGGCLPHPCGSGWARHLAILQGEIPFTNVIAYLGYKVIPFGQPGWNWETNLCLPYAEWVKHEGI